MSADRRGVTLALGTGLLKCSAAVGMMQVLRQEDITVERIVASGPGAAIGAALALGFSEGQTLDLVGDLANFYKEGEISLTRRLQMALFGLSNRFGLLDGDAYNAVFQKHFAGATFADLQIPFLAVATNFVNAQRLVIDSGSIAEAAAISGIIPGVIPPAMYQHQLLVGGAVSDPLPLSVAMEQGSDVILTMAYEAPYLSEIGSIRDFIYQLNNLHTNHLLGSETALSNLAHHSEIIPVNPRFGIAIGLADVEKLSFIVEKGAEATQDVVNYLHRLLR